VSASWENALRALDKVRIVVFEQHDASTTRRDGLDVRDDGRRF
jgi:hypothetical protein